MSGMGDFFAGGSTSVPPTNNQAADGQSVAGGDLVGAAIGKAGDILKAVIPVIQNLVKGMFSDHTPAWYFDNGCDKLEEYITGCQVAAAQGKPSGDLNYAKEQIVKILQGLQGFLAGKGNGGTSLETYAGGAPLYYLSYVAFPIKLNAGNSKIIDWAGDINLQKAVCALYVQGALPTHNLFFAGRPDYNITDAVTAIKANAYYQTMIDNDIDGAATKVAVMELQQKAKTFLQQYWYLLLIPLVGLVVLIKRRKRR